MYNRNLIKIIDSLGFKYANTQISSDLDVSKGTVSSYLNGKIKASDNFLKKFANFYKVDYNDIAEEEEIETTLETPIDEGISGYYYPDVRASAGLETAFENSEITKIPVSIPNFGRDIDFINVYGDSMYPKYCSGEIIGIKEVEPEYVNYGYAYVVIFNDGQVFLKYIKKGKDEKHWLLDSENPKYEAKEYHLKLIKKIFIIKGVITKTTM